MFLNEFDLLLIVFLLIGVMIGAYRGGVRQIIGLLSMWLGLVICLWLYQPFSRVILRGLYLKVFPGATVNNAVFDTFSFIMLLIIFAGAMQFLLLLTTKTPEAKKDTSGRSFIEKANEKKRINGFNVVVGLLTGFVTATVWLSIAIAPVQYVLYSVNSTTTLQRGLQGAMATSTLVPYAHQTLYWIYLSLRLFIPPVGLPTVFSSAIRTFLS